MQVQKLHSATFFGICKNFVFFQHLGRRSGPYSVVETSALIVTQGDPLVTRLKMLRKFEIQPLQEANLGMAHALFDPQRYLY